MWRRYYVGEECVVAPCGLFVGCFFFGERCLDWQACMDGWIESDMNLYHFRVGKGAEFGRNSLYILASGAGEWVSRERAKFVCVAKSLNRDKVGYDRDKAGYLGKSICRIGYTLSQTGHNRTTLSAAGW